ncbi:RHS repeat-associated core domain-containing protein [Dokdonella sp.]|uniref:RHS repeat-associated core domain-containing protein n=1 Tax=Dokdonella sp. TaxID=2291710 RepID=UPI0027B91B60|nr:RHS repeat-associated core domain-containing protein [Dokdonella sp.]
MSWAASPSACVTSYVLEELHTSANPSWQTVPLSDTQIQQRSWSPNPPKSVSGTYAYRVYACGGGNCSTYMGGQGVTVTLPVTLAVPAELRACKASSNTGCAPAGSTLYMLSGKDFTVRWDAVANAVVYEYRVEQRDGQNQNWQALDPATVTLPQVGGNETPTPLQGWIERRYFVRACAGNTCSDWTPVGVTVRVERTPARPAATGTIYYHTDALGSPVAQTDASGAVIKRTAYRPWGAPADGSYEQGPGYTGHVTDARTGLSYMQQRYYDPIAGRFLSVDPVAASPESFNRYWYANNNPYRFTDPDESVI